MTLQSTTLRATAAAPPLDRSRRSALAEISLPNHPTKRKASNLTSDSKRKRQKTAVQGATKRKMPKSNPPKTESSKGKGIAPDEKDYAPNGHGELAQGRRGRKNNANPQKSYALRSRQASRSRTGSPVKQPSTPKSVKNLGDDYKPDHVVLEFLEKCDPPIYLRTIGQIRERGIAIPVAIIELFELIQDAPVGTTIPLALKVSARSSTHCFNVSVVLTVCQEMYDKEAGTPRQSKESPRKREYSSPETDLWRKKHLPYLKSFVEHIMQEAEYSEPGYECQWEDVVFQITTVFALLPEAALVRSINVRTIQMAPKQIWPEPPQGQPGRKSQGQTSKDSRSDGGKELSLQRQVDRVMALKISLEVKDRLNKAFSAFPLPNLHSVNQTLGSTSLSPIWLNLELKKRNQPVDPRIQLAIWATAGIKKRQPMGWDDSFPIPGIMVEGHIWRLYIFFVLQNSVMMMGALKIGSTETLSETWQLLHVMYLLVRWASTKFKKWFEDVVLAWADDCAAAARNSSTDSSA
ncbi:MAG: hypothetical protein LQ350_007876 [Teloschistes chrysophthalmus]|nr:MAG: hypothetical protein LQ350_007876 [Niorma chrysophthalma]